MTNRTHPPNIQLIEPEDALFTDTSTCIPGSGIVTIRHETDPLLIRAILVLFVIAIWCTVILVLVTTWNASLAVPT